MVDNVNSIIEVNREDFKQLLCSNLIVVLDKESREAITFIRVKNNGEEKWKITKS